MNIDMSIEDFARLNAGCVVDKVSKGDVYISGFTIHEVFVSYSLEKLFRYDISPVGDFIPVVLKHFVRNGAYHNLEFFKYRYISHKYCNYYSEETVVIADNDNMFPHKCPLCNQDAYVGFSNIEHKNGKSCNQ